MVIVDSSVWIDLLRNRATVETQAFEHIAADQEVGLGDLILFEVLSGVKPDEQHEKVKSHLLRFDVYTMGGRDLVLEAINNTRNLRTRGIQVGAVDCLIATFCLVSGSNLLSSDHHFKPFVDFLGLAMAI